MYVHCVSIRVRGLFALETHSDTNHAHSHIDADCDVYYGVIVMAKKKKKKVVDLYGKSGYKVRTGKKVKAIQTRGTTKATSRSIAKPRSSLNQRNAKVVQRYKASSNRKSKQRSKLRKQTKGVADRAREIFGL
jgi:hypothetical protein